MYSNTKLHYSDISGLSAYAMAQKLGIDPGDTKHFVGTDEVEDSCYYDLIRLGTPDGDITAEKLEKKKNQKKEITYEKDKMSIVYSNIPFFYWESLPDFKQAYGALDSIPPQDTYVWRTETEREPAGQQKDLADVSGMINYDYCAVSLAKNTGGYNIGDIVSQTLSPGEELDTSKTKLDEPLIYAIGDEVLYSGKTGNQLAEELASHWGDSVSVAAGGSGIMSQPILSVTVTDVNGTPIDYFRKGDAITVTLNLKATPTPVPPPPQQPAYSDGGGYSGGGSSGGGYSGGSGSGGGSGGGRNYFPE